MCPISKAMPASSSANPTPRPRAPQLARLRDDGYLAPHWPAIERRAQLAREAEARLTAGKTTLADFASAHEFFGLHRQDGRWVFREWAPNATAIYLIGAFSDWRESPHFQLERTDQDGVWRAQLPSQVLAHGDLYRLRVHWPGGSGDRIPAYARRVVQDPHTKIFNAQVWAPVPYAWRHESPARPPFALIYESHVGMAQERPGIGTYEEFRTRTLPRVLQAGYNVLQLMAVMEHPYYGSFGYHVANYFAASSRFGTPEELKALVDDAHAAGLYVIMDLVHSHSVRNEVEGLSRFDGTPYQYFHDGPRGDHLAWDSRCFDYGKTPVLHFLLSNCRFWLDEYRLDGFRFDGVTSMLYRDHGLGPAFTSYDRYFDASVDEDALTYLTLAGKVIHAVKPGAIMIAEDVSGMPGLGAPAEDDGCGFDYRLAMGVPDCWFKLFRDTRDDDWHMGHLWHELTNRRGDERTIGYVESHDQAIVGGKTAIFQLIDAPMYEHMRADDPDLSVDRGMALHKMSRLATLSTAAHGYLNFMGNEFGHPEWVDFPREGNGWSYHYARRQWHLRDDPGLKYRFLADFDRAMLGLPGFVAALASSLPRLLVCDERNKILAFDRGGLVVIFNFHPTASLTDYAIEAPRQRYALALDTDERRFGGHGRLQPGQSYHAIAEAGQGVKHRAVRVYAPCRVGMILNPL